MILNEKHKNSAEILFILLFQQLFDPYPRRFSWRRQSKKYKEIYEYILENKKLKKISEAEFKEFEPRLRFETRLKHGWFHLKLYSVFRDFSWSLIGTGFWRFSDAV